MNPSRHAGALFVVAALTATLAAGCTGGAPPASPPPPSPSATPGAGDRVTPAREVKVYASDVLSEAFTVLGRQFEAIYPDLHVVFTFGPGNVVAQQVTAGAAADVFAADPVAMRRVTDARLARGATRILVRNWLVIAVPRGNPARVGGLADVGRPGVRVAVCSDHLPCGAATTRVLAAGGVTVTPVATEHDATTLLAKVRRGEVDAALAYRSDVKAAGAAVSSIELPNAAQAADAYPVVALKSAANPDGGAAFIGYASSALGRKVLEAAGFGPPD
jgi:molybdate transport system substrate-binding protein